MATVSDYMPRLSTVNFPATCSRLLGYFLSALGGHGLGAGGAAKPAQFLSGLVLAVVGRFVFGFLAHGNPHDLDGVADHVGGALLAIGSSGH